MPQRSANRLYSYTSEKIRAFAAKYHVRLNDRRHERIYGLDANEDTIHGRYGEIVDDPTYGHVLAVKFIAVPRTANMKNRLLRRYRQALADGLSLKKKYGDAESTFHFDPDNDYQSRLAIRLVAARVQRTRILTDEQKKAIADRLLAARRSANGASSQNQNNV